MFTIYGIKNCGTVKKTLTWFDDHGLINQLHDYRKDGLDEIFLNKAFQKFGYEALVNKRGTTWRKLDDATKANIDEATARQLMTDNPALIKRPIVQAPDGSLYLGFDTEAWNTKFTSDA